MTQSLYVMMGKPPSKTGAVRLNKAQSAALRKHIKFPSSVTKRSKARVAHRARNITRRKKKKKK